MNILIACEESQNMCEELRKFGHNAYSCDIQFCSGGHPEWHIQENVLNILNPWYGEHFESDLRAYQHTHVYTGIDFETCDGHSHCFKGGWDLIISHPPCTYMSNAGACRMYPTKGHIDQDRYAKAMDAKEFFMTFYNIDYCPVIIENPRPLKCVGLPKEDQRIQPYQFGEPWSKLTYLWIRNTNFRVHPTDIVDNYKPFIPSGTSRKLGGDSYGAKGCAHCSKPRSKTFKGIAKAFATQITEYFGL